MKTMVAIFVVALILVLVGVFYFRACEEDKPKPPPDTRPQIPVVEKPAVNRNEQSLPPELGAENARGRLKLKGRNARTGEEIGVDVLIPIDDSAPIVIPNVSSENPVHFGFDGVYTDTGMVFSAEYEPFRDPRVTLEPHIFIGASISRGGVSPFAGVSFVNLTRFDLRAGLGADRFGGGVFAAWEFVREWNLHGQYSILKWEPTSRISIGVSYRL